MSASENEIPRRPDVVSGVSMRDLLAAGAAARVISTPPVPAGEERPKTA